MLFTSWQESFQRQSRKSNRAARGLDRKRRRRPTLRVEQLEDRTLLSGSSAAILHVTANGYSQTSSSGYSTVPGLSTSWTVPVAETVDIGAVLNVYNNNSNGTYLGAALVVDGSFTPIQYTWLKGYSKSGNWTDYKTAPLHEIVNLSPGTHSISVAWLSYDGYTLTDLPDSSLTITQYNPIPGGGAPVATQQLYTNGFYSTSSTAFSSVPGLSTSVSLSAAGTVDVNAILNVYNNSGTQTYLGTSLLVDGSYAVPTQYAVVEGNSTSGANELVTMPLHTVLNLSAGYHTISVLWQSGGATLETYPDSSLSITAYNPLPGGGSPVATQALNTGNYYSTSSSGYTTVPGLSTSVSLSAAEAVDVSSILNVSNQTPNNTYVGAVLDVDGALSPVQYDLVQGTSNVPNYDTITVPLHEAMYLAPGSHSISVLWLSYNGAQIYATPSSSLTVIQHNPFPDSPTTTQISAPTVTYNANGIVQVIVSSAAGTPTGNASLSVDGGSAIAGTLNNGVATFNVGSLSAGDHNVYASYADQNGFAFSSATGTLHVNQAATSLAINAPAIQYNANGTVTVTATAAAGVPTPSGRVTLTIDGNAVPGSVALSAGQATYSIPSPSAGDHSLVASFAAQGNYAASTATATLHVDPASTMTSINTSNITYGANDTVTVTVASAAGTPTGSVSLMIDNGTPVSMALDANGQATFPVTMPSAGTHTLYAVYAGQGNFAGSSANSTLGVSQAATSLALNAPAITYNANGTVTVTASSAAGPPSGSVTLSVDGTSVGSQSLDGNGQAVFTLTSPSAGSHALHADYAAQGNFAGSSADASLFVSPASTAVGLSAADVTYNADGTVTVTLTSASGTPTGSVSLSVDGNAAGSQTLDGNGQAVFTLTSPSAGSHSLHADYAAQGNFAGSSADGSIFVIQAPTALSLSAPDIGYGSDGLVTVSVSVAAGVPAATGSISLSVDGGTALTQALSGGAYTFDIQGLHAGIHSLSATYTAQGNYAGSSATGTLNVTQAMLTVTAASQTKTYGQTDPTLTYQVSGLQYSDTATSILSGSINRVAGEHAGSYAIGQGTLVATADYNLNFVGNSLTITPAPLTITADDQTMVYGSALPSFTASYSGFVNGDSAASLTTPPTISTTATSASDVVAGGYAITASGAVDPDYAINYVPGTLTITPANQTITWSTPANIVVGTALGSSQLDATVSVVGPAAAGTLTYSPAAGTVLALGTQTLHVSAAATQDYNAATLSVPINVVYNFSGFEIPYLKALAPGSKFGLGSTVSLEFQLHDAAGNLLSDLSDITSLQVAPVNADGSLGTLFTPASLYNKGFFWDKSNDHYNWVTKGLSAGTYELILTLADGTVNTTTLQLVSKSGTSADTAAGNGAGSVGTAQGLLLGDLYLYVNDPAGWFTADEQARIQDAITSVDQLLDPYGVQIYEVSDPTIANLVLDNGTSSASGTAADGVLGCFDGSAMDITLLQGWNWYAGADPSQIAAGQYDFETVVVHELGHALGLGHSADATSVMSATLADATVNRALSSADLNIADSGTGADALHAVLSPAPARNVNPALVALASSTLSGDHAAASAPVGLVAEVGPGTTARIPDSLGSLPLAAIDPTSDRLASAGSTRVGAFGQTVDQGFGGDFNSRLDSSGPWHDPASHEAPVSAPTRSGGPDAEGDCQSPAPRKHAPGHWENPGLPVRVDRAATAWSEVGSRGQWAFVELAQIARSEDRDTASAGQLAFALALALPAAAITGREDKLPEGCRAPAMR